MEKVKLFKSLEFGIIRTAGTQEDPWVQECA